MEKELADITKDENTAIAEFESLVAAKEKEIAAATEAIEMKLEKNGEMAVKIVNLKNDLEDAQESLGEDQKFLAELKKGCSTAGADYDSRVKARAEELVAVQETIKILNDDDASADRQMYTRHFPFPAMWIWEDCQLRNSHSRMRKQAARSFRRRGEELQGRV